MGFGAVLRAKYFRKDNVPVDEKRPDEGLRGAGYLQEMQDLLKGVECSPCVWVRWNGEVWGSRGAMERCKIMWKAVMSVWKGLDQESDGNSWVVWEAESCVRWYYVEQGGLELSRNVWGTADVGDVTQCGKVWGGVEQIGVRRCAFV